ncbi:PTS sugar transporter subunit IIA [Alkalibacter rhizosphaerae]|uniref:PTS sugar transporter subunit IIA n=1 Tax=Alkalibacter rhizosphaerae TaxID=2815577 RepID=A0A974XGB6_9FIRM|nr:PTS sugar transporter subunit IIA [Alkalibacter rhizosphaerae]QSX09344.1 PTS sugar transporter subunit IIA [Alkalibacter rhizosphaerae]
MEITKLLSKERATFELKSNNKEDVIKELTALLAEDGVVTDAEVFIQAVMKREADFSTGIGMGVAIPHGKSTAVKEAALAFGKSTSGIDYESMDDKPAHLFFMIAVPEASSDVHLKVLAELSRKLMHEEVRDQLMEATTYDALLQSFQ